MKKKMKRFEEGGYTGDDEIVKYRMGMTDKAKAKEEGPSESTIEDESDRGNVSPAAAEFNKGLSGGESEKPVIPKKAAAKLTPKAEPKAKPKAEAETPKKGAEKLRSELSISKLSAPTMIRGSKNTGTDLKSAIFGGSSESPRMKAAKRAQAMDASNYSMKKGGTVKAKSASARADGCAIRGKTRA